MYTVKSNFHIPRNLGGLIEDAFSNRWNKLTTEPNWNEFVSVPVNIGETETAYDIQVVAPGLNKEDFKISLEKDVLHISYEHKEATEETAGKWLRKEYKLKSFRRSFTLSEKVDTTGINAKYTDGVLNLTLPKKENVEPKAQEITVA
jgi:HSP20 family protein